MSVHAGEEVGIDQACEPYLKVRQRLTVEPFTIRVGELADEGKYRDVGKAARLAPQIG